MEQTIKMLNEGFLKKYLKESEDVEEEKDEIEVGDLFINGDETYELLDVKIDEDGEVVVEAENQETGEPEEIEYLSKEEAEERYGEYDPTDDEIEEEEELTDLTVECVNKRKIMEKLNSLTEAQMSPEDEKDSAILRNIVNKSIKRKNAKLTPEEQDVLAKYGLYRNDWGEVKKDVGKNSPYLDPEIVKPNELNYSFQGRTRTRTGYDPKKDKVNLADRARKMVDRGAGYEANRVWPPSDSSREFIKPGETTYTRLKGKGLLDKERALQNVNMQGNYHSMQQALKDRKYYQNRLNNIDSNADDEIAKLRRRIDDINRQRETERKYDSDLVSSQQSRIDKLLRRTPQEESLKEELLDRYVSDFNSDVYNALAKVMFKWDRKDIQPSEKDMDLAYDWFSTHFWNSDDWY